MSTQPIGIFDSGVGGTSIWKEIHRLLPNEHTIYLADSKYAPYGNKTSEEIIKYLKDEGSKWVNDKNPDDDVTFVVIKVK